MLTAGPAPAAVPGLLVAAALLVAVGVAADPAGRLLALPAAALLAALALRDVLLRPVLRADDAGLDVVVGLRRRRYAWEEVEGLRVVTDRRTPVLELDLGDSLVVLTRLRLGRPPADVLPALQALRPG